MIQLNPSNSPITFHSLITAALVTAQEHYKWDIIAFKDGFKWLMSCDPTTIKDNKDACPHMILTTDDVSRIHFSGGTIIGSTRANPTSQKKGVENVLECLKQYGVDYLVTIGGDDTCRTAVHLHDESQGKVKIVHVPKTIDNDLPLPLNVPTFGYETAREVGSTLVHNIMVDAETAPRWFICVTMGRKSGFLALGIAKSAGATLCLIPEEFGIPSPWRGVSFDEVLDILEGSVIKSLALGRRFGVAVLAEGLLEGMDDAEIRKIFNLEVVPRDQFGHIKTGDIDFGRCVRDGLRDRMKDLNVKVSFMEKDLGYELRCAPPNAFDSEYTRKLGYKAVSALSEEKTGIMVAFDGANALEFKFDDIFDRSTRHTKIRMVNINSASYRVAREYMTRLEKSDFYNTELMQQMSSIINITPTEFTQKYGYLFGLRSSLK